MDYLVFGVGFGSSLVLVGWLLRQYGSLLRFRDSTDDVLSAEQLLERNDWQRFCVALGALLSVSGAVMLLATLVTMLIHPSDRVGTIIVGIIFTLSLIAVVGWIVMYVNQHRALAGDRREEAIAATTAPRVRKVAKPASDPAATQGSERTTATKKSEEATTTATEAARKRPARQDRVAAAPSVRPDAATTDQSSDAPRDTKDADVPRERVQDPAITRTSESDARPSQAAHEPTTGPIAPALRNLQFKRTAANRAQQERHAAPARPNPPADDPEAN